jgi:hypothetical protein
VHFRYESGLPIITATTINAIRRSKSRSALGRKGRMSSLKRIVVMMQYIAAMQVFS